MERGYRSVQAFEVSSESEIRDVLERIERVLEGRALTSTSEHLRYLDTFDWRIHRSGGWLRESPGRGKVTLHWSSNGHRPLTATSRKSPAFAQDLPDGALREGLQSLVTPRRLLPVAEIARTSQTVELLDSESKIVCRVTAVTSELTGSHIARPTYRILLTGVRGYEDEYQMVDRFLRYQLRLPVSEKREVDEVLERLGHSMGRNPSALNIELSPEMTAGEAVRLVLATLCDVMLVNRHGILDNLDTEFLHDFRVAVRRTRSVLSQAGDVLPRAVVEHYAREFRWLGELTGPARDLDVFLLNMPAYRAALPEQDAAALDRLQKMLSTDRSSAQSSLRKALRGDRFEKLVSTWRSFLLEPTGARQAAPPTVADLPVLRLTNRRTWKRYRKVRRAGRALSMDSRADDMHALRIQAKKLRYLLEVFRSLHPQAPITAGIKELKRIQNTLGEFNDAQVHMKMLRAFAERIGREGKQTAPTLVAIGMLVSSLAAQRAKERESFFKRFEGFDSDENHARFRELFKPERRKNA